MFRNSNNQYSQQPDLFAQQTQQMPMMPTGGYPLVDLGYGEQQMQPQYTSYNVDHVLAWSVPSLTSLALPRANDGSAAATATTRRVHATTNGAPGATTAAGRVDAPAIPPTAAATAANDGSANWIRLQQPVRSRRIAVSATTATAIPPAHIILPPSPPGLLTSTASAADRASANSKTLPTGSPERRWPAQSPRRSPGKGQGGWDGYVRKYGESP